MRRQSLPDRCRLRLASSRARSPAKDRKTVPHGQAHIKSTFNNTIISITDPSGAVVSWASGGQVGFKGSRKSTPYAAQLAAEAAARKAMEYGMSKVDVFVKGPGSGRDTRHPFPAVRRTRGRFHHRRHPQAHNGCRQKKRRTSDSKEKPSHGAYTGPDCKRCRREKTKLFLKGAKCDSPSARSRSGPTRRASTARAVPRRASTCSSCARSRRPAASTGSSRSSSAATTRRRPV